MRLKFPDAYDFYPQTWLLPQDVRALKKDWNYIVANKDPNVVLIVKPEASSQGKGIYLTREVDDIALDEHVVVQLYLNKPLLMDKLKFDLRLYVLVVGVNPLRIYLSKEGLARLSTKQYDQVNDINLTDMQMHLTNYSINKHSNQFEQNRVAILDSTGHKRSLKYTLRYMRKVVKGDDEKLMRDIKDIIVKTCIAGQPALKCAFNQCQLDDFENSMCFQILGFDIMLDRDCKPYLLEVNHSPSFSTDSPLDEKVKGDLIKDTVRLLGMTKKRKALYRRNLQAHLDFRILHGKFLRLPVDLKEQYREDFDSKRDEFEIDNQGAFDQLFPC